MSMNELKAAALRLPPGRRARLAEELLQSLDKDAQRAIDIAWSREAEDRIDAYDAGKIAARRLSAAVAKLRKRFKR
jgi:putative addiction module component (TIGR02574 family)